MASAQLKALVAYCDRTLRTAEITDYDGAVNGLQVENDGTVTRIAAAVDASLTTVKMAVAAGADLLVVHHGLFWGPTWPWTGRRRELLKCLLDHNLAVYSSHLPLDLHPRLGNNARLCRALGLTRLQPFFAEKGTCLGFKAKARLRRTELERRLAKVLNGPVTPLPGGPEECRCIGVVSGGAGSQLKLAASEGVDTFITGEGPHWSYAMAEDLGLNVFYGGHYATETFGVKALAAELAQKAKVPWVFLDHPTGL